MDHHQYKFRPPTQPVARNKASSRWRELHSSTNAELEVIRRPQENFFKLIFQRDNHLWVIYHKHVRSSADINVRALYHRMTEAYKNIDIKEDELPICTDLFQLKNWTSKYVCRIAIDQSALEDFDSVLSDPNAISFRVINDKNIEVVRKIRKSPYSYKVRAIDDSFDQTLAVIKEDMQRVKVVSGENRVEQVRLPNFMQLRLKDKAAMIAYRSNVYCLTNLHKNKVDMESSKARFLEQARKQNPSAKDQGFIQYYSVFPLSDKQILKLYTEDSFFYRCLNNTLRIAATTEEFFVIGQPFNRMFTAITNTYKEQFPHGQSRQHMKLYRGSDLSADECEKLQKAIGSYIEIQGFVSTTRTLEKAKEFARGRKHNKIIEVIFDDVTTNDRQILKNDYGFVDLKEISAYQDEDEVLFNTLNIFKVVSREERDGFDFYTLRYGTIFNVLAINNPDRLKKHDRIAYNTYKELMGEKAVFQDLGQAFLKNFETQKSVDYYEAKIQEARSQNKSEETELIIKRSEALIQNGEPAKALESMIILMTERGKIKKTSGGRAQFLANMLNDNLEIIKEIDITRKYSEAGHSLDKFEDAEAHLTDTSDAVQDALTKQEWDPDIAFSQVEMKMQLAHIKDSMQRYSEMAGLLREAEGLINEFIATAAGKEVSFHCLRKVYLEKTLVYQLLAKISVHLEVNEAIDIDELESKYDATEKELITLIEDKSYDRSLIEIRKVEIMRRREDFAANKRAAINQLEKSLISIKVSATRDDEIPKTYHMLGEIEMETRTVASTNNAINYLDKEHVIQSQYYGEDDPRSMKTVIDIAQCHRDLKDSQQSVDILRDQYKNVIPFKSKPKHTIVTKTLYTMGLAYLDLGEFSYALQCFEKALNMLQETLTKTELSKYHHKYKIEMQLGRTMTFLTRYNEAEERLNSYHHFIEVLYNKVHSDIANSHNHFAILYLKWKKLEQSKTQFEKSSSMFLETTGENSLVCARINCNLAMIYCLFNQRDDALKTIDSAKRIFDSVYLKNSSESVHSMSYIVHYYYAEIYWHNKEWSEAMESYEESIRTLQQYKEIKQVERANLTSKNTTSLYIGISSIASKRDAHELICKVKSIQCKVKLGDYSFTGELARIIRELEKETKDYEDNEDKQNEAPAVLETDKKSLLKNLLSFCYALNKRLSKGLLKATKVDLANDLRISKPIGIMFNNDIKPI